MPTPNALLTQIKRLAKKGHGSARLYLHVDRDLTAPSYSDACIFRLTCQEEKKGQETREMIEGIPGIVRNGYTSEQERSEYEGKSIRRYSDRAYRPTAGYWSLYASTTFPAVVELLPKDAALSFEVYLDGGTTEGHAKVMMHSDHLYLHAKWTRNGKEIMRRFLIDVSTGPHNTARFGTPTHDLDSQGRAA